MTQQDQKYGYYGHLSNAVRPAGPALEPHQIILRPLVTEKSTELSQDKRTYAFEVSTWANKQDIKAAAETLFSVKVEKVRTMNRAGKVRRFKNALGRLPHWKKAYVTLHPDSPALDLF
jgi:large subunit ribosomal protein L23